MGTQQSEDGSFGGILGLRDEIGEIQSAIADFEVGKRVNVAIIAGILGGKTTLINEIEKLNLSRATKITFSGIVRDKKEITLPEDTKRVVLLDNCHFLYIRKPGGFDILYEFLDMISSQDRIFVTTWNLYSWKYLDKAFNLGKCFPVQVLVPPFTKEEIRSLILKGYEEGEIIFNNGEEPEDESLVYIVEYPLELASLGRKIFIPVPKVNIPYFKRRFLKKEEEKKKKEEESSEYRVFENIHLESKGNPGVANRVWELRLKYPHIKPEDIGHFSYDIELEPDEAFILHLILSYQGLKKDEIADMVGSKLMVDEAIFRLLNQGLVFKLEDNSFRVRPEALRSVITYMEKLRLV